MPGECLISRDFQLLKNGSIFRPFIICQKSGHSDGWFRRDWQRHWCVSLHLFCTYPPRTLSLLRDSHTYFPTKAREVLELGCTVVLAARGESKLQVLGTPSYPRSHLLEVLLSQICILDPQISLCRKPSRPWAPLL